MSDREIVHAVVNLHAAAGFFRYAALHAADEESMVLAMRDWWSAEKAAMLLADEARQELVPA
jgi:hypothetical protein